MTATVTAIKSKTGAEPIENSKLTFLPFKDILTAYKRKDFRANRKA
jgi:hypothetical protein